MPNRLACLACRLRVKALEDAHKLDLCARQVSVTHCSPAYIPFILTVSLCPVLWMLWWLLLHTLCTFSQNQVEPPVSDQAVVQQALLDQLAASNTELKQEISRQKRHGSQVSEHVERLPPLSSTPAQASIMSGPHQADKLSQVKPSLQSNIIRTAVSHSYSVPSINQIFMSHKQSSL